MESGEVLPNAGVSGFDGGCVLLGRQVLRGGQDFSVDRIIVGVEDGTLIPRDMRHQFA